MITPRQKELLDFLRESIAKNEYAPSFDEMAEHMKLKSKSSIFRMLNCLVDRGKIRRLPRRARAIEIING